MYIGWNSFDQCAKHPVMKDKYAHILIDKPRKNAYNLMYIFVFMGVNYMDYMTIKEAAVKWGLSERRVQEICELKRISGITKFGRAWAIPCDTEKPVDLRVKSGKYIKSESLDSEKREI